MALPAAPVEAACGTSWDSRSVPPDRIRVGLVGRDKVEVVDFKRYVAVVMAKEWPSYLPRAAREAGATAVKQYAWYYALEGNHRSGYVTADGDCYDVKNTTVDQLYMPDAVNVDDRIREAVDATWGLSLRKNGQFFLTGYRTRRQRQLRARCRRLAAVCQERHRLRAEGHGPARHPGGLLRAQHLLPLGGRGQRPDR